ncbi:cerberus [Malaclemys terrapin pileata]|uniref:cerberus n=1 Tax=Malaclemys terrapin pileata TaxID=2991368 RepID=UPI0023A8D43B|nr:cerberus [Malaclemys terrapin pileata]
MFLLLLHLLVISGLGATGQGGKLQRNKRRIQHLSYQDKYLLEREGPSKLLVQDPMDYEEILEEPSLFVAAPELATESRKQGEKKSSRFILPYVELDVHRDLGSRTAPKETSHSESMRRFLPSHSVNKKEAEPPYRKDAKKFWDHFMFKKNSASEEVVLPIKTNDMYQETCRTLPFSQSIVHENCEKVVVQNNLCFGKCSSFHVPGPEDRLYTFCSHCLPTKFTMKRLELNCTRSVAVVKVIMIVEDCKCEIQKIKDSDIGPLHSELHSNVYEHN